MPEHEEQNQEAEQMSLGTLSAMESANKSTPAPPKNPQNNLNTPLSAYGEPSVSQTAEPYPNLCKNLLFGGAGSETYQGICSEAATETGVDFSPLTIIPNSRQADAANAQAMLIGDEIHYSTGMFCMDAPESVEIFRHEVQHYIQQKKGQVESTNLSANQNPDLEKSAESAEKGNFEKGADGTNSLSNEEVAQYKPTTPFDLNAPTAKSPTNTKKLYVYGTDAIIVDSASNEAWYLENADKQIHGLQHFEENQAAWTPFSEEDYKVCKMTPPANLSTNATPATDSTAPAKSEYWTKELIAPFAKVLAPEQMAELESLLDAIHPDKQNQDSTLTASSNQAIIFPIPLVIPAIIELGEFIILGYITYTTVTTVQAVTLPYIEDLLSRYFSGTMLPTIEVEAERPKTKIAPPPASTGTGWLPWSIYIPKETSKPQSEKPKSEKPKSEKPKKDPKKPSDGGLLPLAGVVAANEWYKNRNKQESPKAELTELEKQELETLTEKEKTDKLSPIEKGRKNALELKKQQPAETIESLEKELERLRGLEQTADVLERIKAIQEKLAKLRKSKRRTLKAKDSSQLGNTANFVLIELIDENGVEVGVLSRELGKNKDREPQLKYDLSANEPIGKFAAHEDIDLRSDMDLIAYGDKPTLSADFEMPVEVTEKFSGLGELMFEDGLKYFDAVKKTKGGLTYVKAFWIRSDEKYAEYGGLSLNLKKYLEALEKFKGIKNRAERQKKAAFETITGKWAAKFGYTDIEKVIQYLVPNTNEIDRIEVYFKKPKL